MGATFSDRRRRPPRGYVFRPAFTRTRAKERQERLETLQRQCDELRRKKAERDKGRKEKSSEARASTTDPEARVMKFSDGGFRPGYNVQFATDTASGIIVGLEVTNAGTDNEECRRCSTSWRSVTSVFLTRFLLTAVSHLWMRLTATEKRGCRCSRR